jgi:hypothetical protein
MCSPQIRLKQGGKEKSQAPIAKGDNLGGKISLDLTVYIDYTQP